MCGGLYVLRLVSVSCIACVLEAARPLGSCSGVCLADSSADVADDLVALAEIEVPRDASLPLWVVDEVFGDLPLLLWESPALSFAASASRAIRPSVKDDPDVTGKAVGRSGWVLGECTRAAAVLGVNAASC